MVLGSAFPPGVGGGERDRVVLQIGYGELQVGWVDRIHCNGMQGNMVGWLSSGNIVLANECNYLR